MHASPMKIVLSAATVAAWVAFLFLDVQWNACLSRAVEAGNKTYGEAYGPLSFFRPLVLYVAFSLSLVCGAWLAFSAKDKKS